MAGITFTPASLPLTGGVITGDLVVDGVAEAGGKNDLGRVRICGYLDSSGAPETGTWATGDLVLDSAGAWHLCTVGGTPGTWT
jgi:hypothetical protein